jgi:superfamily II DNA or RNA helicase
MKSSIKSKKEMRSNQQDMYNVLVDSNESGTIDGVMRSGKTLPALKYLEKTYNANHKVLWIAENSIEKDIQLKEEIDQFNIKIDFKLDITLINSLKKYKNNIYDCIIYNECHTITEKTLTYLNSIHYDRIIGLTGTYPNKYKKKVLLEKLGLNNILHTYTDKEGIKDNIISDYIIKIVKVPLDDRKNIKVTYKNGSFNTSEYLQYIYHKSKLDMIDMQIAPLAARKDKLQEEIDSYKPYKEETGANKAKLIKLYDEIKPIRDKLKPLYIKKKKPSLFLNIFLNKCDSKIRVAKKLLKKYDNKRYLIFAHNDEISKKISKFRFSSKTDNTYFDKFQNEEISHLCLLNKGSTGITYKNLDGCICTTINSSNVSMIQRIGRTLLFDEHKVANIIFLISKDTIQEKWLDKALADLDQSKIKKFVLKV